MELLAACIITVVVLQAGWSFHTACNDCQSQVLTEPKIYIKYSKDSSEAEEEQAIDTCPDADLDELLCMALEVAKAANSDKKPE